MNSTVPIPELAGAGLVEKAVAPNAAGKTMNEKLE